MKSTKILKYVDHLGRFKIPKELLLTYDIKYNSNLRIYKKKNAIILEKEHNNCIFCNSSKNIHYFKDKYICNNCAILIQKKIYKNG